VAAAQSRVADKERLSYDAGHVTAQKDSDASNGLPAARPEVPVGVQSTLRVTLKAHSVYRWICNSGPEHTMHNKANTVSINTAGNHSSALNMPHLTSTGCRQDAGIVEQPDRHNTRRLTDREALKVRDNYKQLVQLQVVLLVL